MLDSQHPGSEQPSPLHVTWQESVLPIGSQVNYYSESFPVHSQGFILKCHCAFNYVVNTLCPDQTDMVIKSDPGPEIQMAHGVLMYFSITGFLSLMLTF